MQNTKQLLVFVLSSQAPYNACINWILYNLNEFSATSDP